ncbi:MAG: DmsE family decaheme c-type cytochrome [Deltaproteobacteria bacterium]|nr:DmsE family decaheme c-type cytochrome [Deltaproteobacteria bacterium]
MNQKKLLPLLLLLPIGIFLLLALSSGPSKAVNAEYVGSAKCQECHGDMAAAFTKTLHGRAWGWTEKKPGDRGCESCHGPGGEHVKNPSKETITTFGKGSRQSADERSAACLSCHGKTPKLTFWDMGQHKKNDVACASCHAVHSKRQARQYETCFACHKDVKHQANKISRHPILEGKVKCSDCHNPHGTLSHGMINADNVNQLCYKCHGDKRGPYVWEHPPVEENCQICHAPHGSKAQKLIKEKIPNLCQDCHDWTRHPGTIYHAGNKMDGPSPSNRFFARSCLNCHNQIHGGYAPVNPSFGYGSGKAFVR